jgi:hypothetical protein
MLIAVALLSHFQNGRRQSYSVSVFFPIELVVVSTRVIKFLFKKCEKKETVA